MKTTHTLRLYFATDEPEEIVTKSFAGFNTAITDDAVSKFGHTIARNQIFLDGHGHIIQSLDAGKRFDTTITDCVITPDTGE